MYTRLYDLDTSGENDWLTYSYVAPDDATRALPAEDWALQPAFPDGRLSGRVGIAQDVADLSGASPALAAQDTRIG